MSNSPLISYTRISPNGNNPRNQPIRKITIHHMAGNLSLESFGNIVAQPSRQMSSNYAIDSIGTIGMFVEEKNRSWCSSSSANDHQAITIEVANDGGAPNWHISDKALSSLICLCVDICRRNRIEKLNFTSNANGNLTQHNYFAATACPGAYLKSKYPYIAGEVNERLIGGEKDMSVFLNLTGHAVGKNNQLFSRADPAPAYLIKDNAADGLYPVINSPVNGAGVADTKWVEIAYNGGIAFAVYGGVAQDKAALLDAKGADKAFGAPMSTGGGVTQEALDAALQRAQNAEAAAGQEKVRADSEAARANKAEAVINSAETIRVLRG